jgi:PhnB protein
MLATVMTVISLAVSATGCGSGVVPVQAGAAEETQLHQVTPYLIFPGTCREALAFYEHCFGGEVVKINTFAESSLDVPDWYGHRIFNSEFRSDHVRLMASDDMPGQEVTVGSNVALFVVFDDRAMLDAVFGKLSEGGNVLFPIDNGFGMLVDRYGIRWMLETRK